MEHRYRRCVVLFFLRGAGTMIMLFVGLFDSIRFDRVSFPSLAALASINQVFASIEVAPARQVLYLRGTELTVGSTLQAANVKAGDTLHLKVT